VQCAEGSPIWITEHGQSAAMFVGKISGLRWLGGAHKHNAAVAGGKLSLAVAQLRDPFSTEQSTKVPHEDRDQWSGVQMRAQRRGAAILIHDRCVEQRLGIRQHARIVLGGIARCTP
jgi:hypothetical protein